MEDPRPHATTVLPVLLLALLACRPLASSDVPTSDMRLTVDAVDDGSGTLTVLANLYKPRSGMFIPTGGGAIDLLAGDRLMAVHAGKRLQLERRLGGPKGEYRGSFPSAPGQALIITLERSTQPSTGPMHVLVPEPVALLAPQGGRTPLGWPTLIRSRARDAIEVRWTPGLDVAVGVVGPCLRDKTWPGKGGQMTIAPGTLTAPSAGSRRDAAPPEERSCHAELSVTRSNKGKADPALRGGELAVRQRRVVPLKSEP